MLLEEHVDSLKYMFDAIEDAAALENYEMLRDEVDAAMDELGAILDHAEWKRTYDVDDLEEVEKGGETNVKPN